MSSETKLDLDRIGFGYLAGQTGAVFETPVSVGEALVAADLDWPVELWNAFAAHPTGDRALLAQAATPTSRFPATVAGDGLSLDPEQPTVDGHMVVPFARVVVRRNADGSCVPLSAVGTRYQLVQNHEAFDFAVDLVQSHGAEVVAAGTYGEPHGKNVFMALRVPRSLILGDDEVVRCYVLLRASHGDGVMQARVVPISERYGVEMMTVIPEAPQEFRITHSGNVAMKLAEAEHVMRMVEEWAIEFEQVSSRMLATRMSADQMAAFANHLLPTPRGAKDRGAEEWAARRKVLIDQFARDRNGFGGGTVFSAFLVASDYIDHQSSVRPGQNPRRVRAERSLNGESRKLKHRAWAWIAKHVDG